MKLVDDLMKDDQAWSLTKIAALVAHVAMATAFVHITWTVGFIFELWITYGSLAIFHRIVVSSTSQFKEFKEQQLDAAYPPHPHQD